MTETRKGEALTILQTFIWGFFPIVTIITYSSLTGLASLAWSMLFAAAFFAIVVTYRKRWHELKNPLLWKYVSGTVFFIGIMFYGLYFTGLTKTTPGNAAIIALFEIFTSYIFFHIIRKEHISSEHAVGAGLMVLGALIVLYPNFSHFNIGDILIFAATFFSPAGSLFTQKARKIGSSESIVFLRCLLIFPAVMIIAVLLGTHLSLTDVRSSLWALLINGAIIMGVSKWMWTEAIHRISVTKALALSSISPLFTLLLAWIFFHQVPTGWQLLSLAPLILGIFLLTDQLRFRKATA